MSPVTRVRDWIRELPLRSVLYVVLAMAVGLAIAMVLSLPIIAAQIRATQVDNTHRSEEQSQTLAIVKDCTQAGGHCYQDNQKRTADVLASIQRIILLSAVCSVDLDPSEPVADRIRMITGCVTRRLAH